MPGHLGRSRSPRRWLAAAVLVALAGGCGSDDDADGASPPASTTTTTAPAALPGERLEIFPYEGARMAVVGVAAGETLPVRAAPSPDAQIVNELSPTDMSATATGHNRSVGDTFWSEITMGNDGRGWAETKFLLQPGAVNDVTAQMFPTPADRPSATTLEELAQAVAGRRASSDPPSRIVVVDGPTVGDLGEVSVDVLGFGDDSVGGERLTIFAQPGAGDGPFTVRSVEALTFCSRGVTGDGLCV